MPKDDVSMLRKVDPAHRKAAEAWLNRHQNPQLGAAYDEGELSVADVMALIHDQVFAVFGELPKYQKRSEYHRCRGQKPARIVWAIRNTEPRDDAEKAACLYVEERLPQAAKYTLREHRGRCRACGEVQVLKSILVETEWLGVPLSRAYEVK